MFDKIFDPVGMVLELKRERNMGGLFLMSIITVGIWAFVAAVAILVAASFMKMMPIHQSSQFILNAPIIAAVAFFLVLVAGFIGLLFLGLIVWIVMNILGGRGEYFEGLAAVVPPAFYLSVGSFIVVIMLFLPLIGFLIAPLLLITVFATSLALSYRAIKELFEVDMIHAFVGVSIVWTVVWLGLMALYFMGIMMLAMMGMGAFMSSSSFGGMMSLPFAS